MQRHPLFFAYVALAAVSFFWGTTYLGIRVALESFPPLVLVATRFLLSGSILLIGAKLRGDALPGRAEAVRTALNGLLILGVANGALTFAETKIPSGLAALFVTTAPFWLAGMDAIVPGGDKLRPATFGGMLVGFAGVALLVAPDTIGAHANAATLTGFLILQGGNCAWTLGSILQRRMTSTVHPVVSGAVQQVTAGGVYAVLAVLFNHEPVRWSTQGVVALLYLVTFGSIVGFSAYLIALARLPVPIVSIYTYINPVVAVSLGWLFYREPFGWHEAGAMLVIFFGVWLVKRFGGK